MNKKRESDFSSADSSRSNNATRNIKIPFTVSGYAKRNFSVPLEMRLKKQWGIAKAVWNQGKGKYEKYPYQINGYPAKSNDPRTWTNFFSVRNAEYLSFFFNHDYTGLDFDNVIHDGKIEDWVLDLINEIQSYTEISISGNGVHIVVKGAKPQGLGSAVELRGHSIEVYDYGRFFLLTGNVFENYSTLMEMDQNKLFKDSVKPGYEGSVLPRHIGDGIKDIETIIEVLTPYWQNGTGKLHNFMLRISGYIAGSGDASISRLKDGKGKVAGPNALMEFLEVIVNESG